MKRFLDKADRVVEKVGDWAMIVSGVLILIIGILTTYGVGKRYIFNNPDPYTYELSIIFLVACILLALPGIQWQRRNLRVDWIVTHFSQKWQNIIGDVFTTILAMMFVSVVIWKSWSIFLYSFQVGETSQSAWQEPLWPMKLADTDNHGLAASHPNIAAGARGDTSGKRNGQRRYENPTVVST